MWVQALIVVFVVFSMAVGWFFGQSKSKGVNVQNLVGTGDHRVESNTKWYNMALQARVPEGLRKDKDKDIHIADNLAGEESDNKKRGKLGKVKDGLKGGLKKVAHPFATREISAEVAEASASERNEPDAMGLMQNIGQARRWSSALAMNDDDDEEDDDWEVQEAQFNIGFEKERAKKKTGLFSSAKKRS